MRLAVLCLFLAAPLMAQTQPPATQQQTQGPCSVAIAGNNNQVFTCQAQGVDKKTADQILRILNRIMANQLDPAAVMAKLEEIQKAVGSIQTATNALDENTLVQIGRLAGAGELIQNNFIKSNDPTLLGQQRAQWINQVYSFLLKNVRESTAIQFLNAHGNAFMGCPTNHSADGCPNWQDIEGKRDFLNNLH